jgi:hypothetical protein
MADILHKVGIKSSSLDDAYKALTTALAREPHVHVDAERARRGDTEPRCGMVAGLSAQDVTCLLDLKYLAFA